MSDTPPLRYAAYPRPKTTETYGSVEKMRALGEAVFGLGNVFACTALAYLVTFIVAALFVSTLPLIVLPVLIAFMVGAASRPHVKKIAEAKDWSPRTQGIIAGLLGVNSVILFGIFGSQLLQFLAMKELRKYGVRQGPLGLKKEEFDKLVQQRLEADAAFQAVGDV